MSLKIADRAPALSSAFDFVMCRLSLLLLFDRCSRSVLYKMSQLCGGRAGLTGSPCSLLGILASCFEGLEVLVCPLEKGVGWHESPLCCDIVKQREGRPDRCRLSCGWSPGGPQPGAPLRSWFPFSRAREDCVFSWVREAACVLPESSSAIILLGRMVNDNLLNPLPAKCYLLIYLQHIINSQESSGLGKGST